MPFGEWLPLFFCTQTEQADILLELLSHCGPLKDYVEEIQCVIFTIHPSIHPLPLPTLG